MGFNPRGNAASSRFYDFSPSRDFQFDCLRQYNTAEPSNRVCWEFNRCSITDHHRQLKCTLATPPCRVIKIFDVTRRVVRGMRGKYTSLLSLRPGPSICQE